MNKITINLIIALCFYAVSCAKSPDKSGDQKNSSDKEDIISHSIHKLYKYNEAVKLVKEQNKTLFIDFYADWCGYCKKMEETTLSDPKIREKLDKNFIRVRIHSDKPDHQTINYKNKIYSVKEFTALMEVRGLPTVIFLNKDEDVITVIPGYINKEVFSPILNYIIEECYKKNISFDLYLQEKISCLGKS